MSGPTDADAESETDHLEDLPDGCGCAEVWEFLSERREDASKRDR